MTESYIEQLQQRLRDSEQRERQLREALMLVLPMAKGYAHEHPVGGNQGKVNHAASVLAGAEEIQPCPFGCQTQEEHESHYPSLAASPAPSSAEGDSERTAGPLELTGHQVNLLGEFTDGEHMPAGLYDWSVDYPEEGVMLLPEDPSETDGEPAPVEKSSMNDVEFRCILDWRICSDPFPESVNIEVIDQWIHNESVRRGYSDWAAALHEHFGAAPIAVPSAPVESEREPLKHITNEHGDCVSYCIDQEKGNGNL